VSSEAGPFKGSNNESARREVELASLTSRMVAVVEKTVQPATVTMWLKKGR
jgi:hypothetical protein